MTRHLKGIAAFVLTFLSLAALTLTARAATETLFFTVSRIDFSLVGEKEDIYIGTVPRDKVQWESANPAVATWGRCCAASRSSRNARARLASSACSMPIPRCGLSLTTA